jgi:hypothetical protein
MAGAVDAALVPGDDISTAGYCGAGMLRIS